jgi:hypothetical protein
VAALPSRARRKLGSIDRSAGRPNTRRAVSPQAQVVDVPASDMGWAQTKSPHREQRYEYIGTLTPPSLLKLIATQSVMPRMSSGLVLADLGAACVDKLSR